MVVLPVATFLRATGRALAVEQRRLLHQVKRRSIRPARHAQAAFRYGGPAGQGAGPGDPRQFRDGTLVSRHEDADIDAALAKRRRQSGGSVAQAPAFASPAISLVTRSALMAGTNNPDLQNRPVR